MVDDRQIQTWITDAVKAAAQAVDAERPAPRCQLFFSRQMREITDQLNTITHAIAVLQRDVTKLLELEARVVALEKIVEDHERERAGRKKVIGWFAAGVGFVVMRTMWEVWAWLVASVGVGR